MDLKAKIDAYNQQLIDMKEDMKSINENMKKVRELVRKYQRLLKHAQEIESVEEKPLVNAEAK